MQVAALFNEAGTNGPLLWSQGDTSDIRAQRRNVAFDERINNVLVTPTTALFVAEQHVHAYPRLLHRRLWTLTTQGVCVYVCVCVVRV